MIVPSGEPPAGMAAHSADLVNVLLTPPEPWGPRRAQYCAGAEPDPFAIYRAMASEGVVVRLLDPTGWPRNPLYGRHGLYMGIDPWRAQHILIRERHVDLVLSIFESSCLLPLLFRRLAGYRPKIAMWDITPTRTWRPRKRMQDVVVPRVDHLFLLSAGQQPILQERWGAAAKTSVVYQHVDADFFSPRPPDDGGLILSVGDDIGRDFDTLMQAVHDLDIRLRVKTRLKLPSLPGRRATVEQVAGRLSFCDFRSLYEQSDFVVIPLHVTENVSGVGSVLEAMAMGKALVLSDNPVIRDYVIPNETALLVPPGDPRALREAIQTLRQDKSRAAFLGQRGRRFVEQMFANAVFGKRMASAIRRVVGRA
jgi:glycosyltransferase involved in cell wall biosynthesis